MKDDVTGDLLAKVSRSFYLSLAILPRPLREPIALAYLLARAADTVADTRLLPRPDRIRYLDGLRAAYAGRPAGVAAVAAAAAPLQEHAAERRLLERVAEVLARVEALAPRDRDEVRRVVDTLTSGMRFDLTRFPGDDASTLAALDTLDELDHYIYLVAGCVGPFWTALHAAHRPRLRAWNVAEMSARGIRFGKALQLTNVLRDVPADLQRGRCYVPAAMLAEIGLKPIDLVDPARTSGARPVLERLRRIALAHYDAAWAYTLAIPRLEWRMRLACAWPLLIGLATLRALAAHPDPLAASGPIKIPRGCVRRILARSAVAVWSNRALAREAARMRPK